MIDKILFAYILLIGIGFGISILSLSNLSLGFSIWLALYPLTCNLVVPSGWEKFPPSRLVNLLFGAVIIILRMPGSKLKFPQLGKIFKSYSLFILMALISAGLSEMPREASLRAMAYLEPLSWLVLAYFSVQGHDQKKQIRRLWSGALAGFCVVLLFGMLELAAQRNFLLDFGILRSDLDFLTTLMTTDIRTYIEDVRFGISGRLISTIGQPVYASLYALLMIYLTYYLMQNVFKSLAHRFCGLAIIILGLIFIFFAGARTAYAGLVLYPAILYLYSSSKARMRKALIASLAVFSILVFIPLGFPEFIESPVNMESSIIQDASVRGRWDVTMKCLDLFVDNPVFGVGPGYIQNSTRILGEDTYSLIFGVENQFALILAENGMAGLATYVLFIITAIRLVNASRREADALAPNYCVFAASALTTMIVVATTVALTTSIVIYYLMVFLGSAVSLRDAAISKVSSTRSGARFQANNVPMRNSVSQAL